MTFKQLWLMIRTTWQSRPFAILLPLAALGWFFFTHGHDWKHPVASHSIPTWQEWMTLAALFATKGERLTEFLFGAPSPASLPAPVKDPVITPKVGAVLLLLGIGFALQACTLTKAPVDGGTTPGAAFGHCTSSALTTSAEGILGDVTTALATGDYVGGVAALATKFGTAEVGCAIDLIIAEFSAKASRTDDAQVGVILAHAQSIRKDNP